MNPARWPVELSDGPVVLRPWRLQDRRAWDELRQRNAAWTGPWDSTRPPDSIEPPLTFAGMVRQFNRRARLGAMLPFAIDCSAVPSEVGSGRLVGETMFTSGWLNGLAFRSASGWARLPVWMAWISGATIGMGESCQFQNRVMSSFSAEL